MTTKIKYYISDVTGNKYSREDYAPHGYGGIKHGYKDLPHDEYPYSLEYEEEFIPLWKREN